VPEYLAPGVYVEEVSFRAKSIEGVSTSTTAFAGPTRKGPVGGVSGQIPELLTSFGDFERIYGGVDDLSFGLNYLAHSVRAYFNEGGSRLYVSRTFITNVDNDGRASALVVSGATAPEQARFFARFPGDAGNGQITVRQVPARATRRTMETARPGTVLGVGTAGPAGPARITGGVGPFSVPNGGILRLAISGANSDITFNGRSAEATAANPLAANTTIDAGNRNFRVVLNNVEQTVVLPLGDFSREDLVIAINSGLRGGYARITEADEAPADRLVIGSDRLGTQSSVTIPAASFGFDAGSSGTSPAGPNNNVGDLSRVTADEINALMPATVGAASSEGRLVISTVATGAAATLGVVDATAPGVTSAHSQMGLTAGGPAATGSAGSAVTYFVKRGANWVDSGDVNLNFPGSGPADVPAGGADFITLNVTTQDRDGNQMLYEDIGFDPSHPRYVGNIMAMNPPRRSDFLDNFFGIEIGSGVSAFELLAGLFPTGQEQREVTLTGGNDGLEPTLGLITDPGTYEAAFAELEALEDVSIVAAPGSSSFGDSQAIQGGLIAHAERRRAYRIAVLDTRPGEGLTEARVQRSQIDSTRAALYFPWVIVSNPLARPGVENIPREIALPPSGFVCGIYARNDIERGVFKAPANEVVRGALRFDLDINFAQQQVLNPLGVNCLRYLSGRGFRVWGARTATSDPEWKYVNVRRYFNYLEASIDRGTQWAVFEPNGERLWANIRDTVSSFLLNEWKSGALLGATTEEAFFVRCDRSTMTQNDLDNGRLICLIGVAVVKPAEFVIFRIGQKTADARS
jgi:phage tail sheath protein FI